MYQSDRCVLEVKLTKFSRMFSTTVLYFYLILVASKLWIYKKNASQTHRKQDVSLVSPWHIHAVLLVQMLGRLYLA